MHNNALIPFIEQCSDSLHRALSKTTSFHILIYIYIYIEIEKVDVFRKVLNKQFIERLRALFIINKTQLQTPTDCFTPWGGSSGGPNPNAAI